MEDLLSIASYPSINWLLAMIIQEINTVNMSVHACCKSICLVLPCKVQSFEQFENRTFFFMTIKGKLLIVFYFYRRRVIRKCMQSFTTDSQVFELERSTMTLDVVVIQIRC